MRAPAIRRKGAASFEELKPACQILILHEDFPAYAQAVEVCRRVMERFASELDFDIKCWNFIELADPNCARHAAKTAGAADIILLAMQTARLPVELDRWLDFSFNARFRNEGVLALILDAQDSPPMELQKLSDRLNHLTGRLGIDFISLRPGDDAAVINRLPATLSMPREIRK
jgi:hypothetical protein